MGKSSGESEDGQQDTLSKLVSGGMLVSAGRFVALILGFATQVIMARFLTEAGYGEVILSITILNFTAIFTKLGLDDGVIHEFSQFEDDPEKARGVARAAMVIATLSGTIGGVVVFFSAPWISSHVFENESLTLLIKLIAVAVPFTTVRAVSVALARSAQDARTHTYVDQLAQPIGRFALVAGLVLAGFGAAGATAAQAGSVVFAGLLALVLTRRTLPAFTRPPASMYRTVLTFSLPLIAVQSVNTVLSQIDIYALGYYWTPEAVGNYNIILQLSNLFHPALMSMAFLLPPVLASLHNRGETNEMRKVYRIITKWVVIVVLPLLVLFLFAPRLIISTLFGERYVDTALPLQILAIANFFSVSMGLVNGSLIGLGENRLVAYLVGFQLAINGILDYLLVPEFAATGAALATAVAIVLNNAAGIVVMNNRFGIHPLSRTWIALITAVAITATAAYVCIRAFGFPIYTVVAVVGIVYPVIVLRLALEPDDDVFLTLIEERTDRDLSFVRHTINGFR